MADSVGVERIMLTKERLLTLPKGALGLAICVFVSERIDAGLIPELPLVLAVLRKRFAASITLGMSGGGRLEPEILQKWLVDGLIDQTICSGHESLVLNDLVDAAIRSNALTAVFADVNELLSRPARMIRFVVAHQGMTRHSALSADGAMWHAGQSQLRDIPKVRFPANWNDGLRYVHSVYAPGKQQTLAISREPALESISATQSHRLFVTETGLSRLGGWETFRTRPIRFGGIDVSQFDAVSVLSLNRELQPEGEDAWRTVPGIVRSGTDGESVVFDIWPAPYSPPSADRGSENAAIDLPRQILVGRRCPVPVTTVVTAREEQEAVYIMSNFNKARYLHAALYGWLMQTHSRIKLEIVDDISTDESVEKTREFFARLSVDPALFTLEINEATRGTYWIRNLIISRNRRDDVVFFVNDSDDISSALRTTLQIGALTSMNIDFACLFNIIRVDGQYAPLPLNDEVERYGTASLCFKANLIDKVGFFQNIRKNADTEFIRRVKRFAGKSSLSWIKLPVMFQPFDGGNLTADICSLSESGGKLTVDNNLRAVHIEIADHHHQSLDPDTLPAHFDFPLSTLPQAYARLGHEFLIDGYRLPDTVVVVLQGSEVEQESSFLLAGVSVVVQGAGNDWIVKTSEGDEIQSSSGFFDVLKQYSERSALHAYVTTSQLVSNLREAPDRTDGFGGKEFSNLVLRSKAKGDRYAMKYDGSWHDVHTFFEKKKGKPDSDTSIDVSSMPSLDIPAFLHTSSLAV
ncbi:glycosyltransferase involved in cell wall biosynthesis [Paraburkholderia sp. MM5496-R1]|uniref:glycosyltransferase family A protein n=1 Tax=Paraburkholderia sp. MM5496-R1 TaxID=2991065 RepID=UPI003D25EB4E